MSISQPQPEAGTKAKIPWTPAAEGALTAIGVLALFSAVQQVPYLTSGYDDWWRNGLHIVSHLVVALAGATALLSLLTGGSTRIVAGIVAIIGAGARLLSVLVENIRWFGNYSDGAPGEVVAAQLIWAASGVAVVAIVATLGLFLLIARRR